MGQEDLRTRLFLFCLSIGLLCLFTTVHSSTIRGRIVDAASGQPLPYATIRIAGTAKSTASNANGVFRLLSDSSRATIYISHLGYHTSLREIVPEDTLEFLEISLSRSVLEIPGYTVTANNFSPEQRMIEGVIARLKQRQITMSTVNYDCYLKEVWRDQSKDSSRNIFFIGENQITCWWQYPDNFREVLQLRRQPKSIPADLNDLRPGTLLDFNSDHIAMDVGYVVSPVGAKALDHYDYYLIDSTVSELRKLYTLLVEPKNDQSPAFLGRIQLVDSTFDLAIVDIEANDAALESHSKREHIRVQYSPFENGFWFPTLVSLDAEGSIWFPGFPRHMSIEYIASIHNYDFNPKIQGTLFEMESDIAPLVDEFDSSAWAAGQTVPLTADEASSYARIDSSGGFGGPWKNPVLLALVVPPLALAGGIPELFHYNRVEGAYLGVNVFPIRLPRSTRLSWSVGYAFGLKTLSYDLRLRHHPKGGLLSQIAVSYKRKVGPNQLVNKGIDNTVTDNLYLKRDPLDYRYERGYRADVTSRPLEHISCNAGFKSFDQKSVQCTSDFSILFPNRAFRENESIAEGTLRALDLTVRFDSRKVKRTSNQEYFTPAQSYSSASLQWTCSSRRTFRSDFEFSRTELNMSRTQYWQLAGDSKLELSIGNFMDESIPQERFTFAGDTDFLRESDTFLSLGEQRFSVDRYVSIYGYHGFPSAVWRSTPLKAILKYVAPGLRAAILWTDGDYLNKTGTVSSAQELQSEIGVTATITLPIVPFLQTKLAYVRNLGPGNQDRDFFFVGASL